MGLMSSDTFAPSLDLYPKYNHQPFSKTLSFLACRENKNPLISQLQLGDCCGVFEYYQSISLAVWTTWILTRFTDISCQSCIIVFFLWGVQIISLVLSQPKKGLGGY
jgi:hypothetical protein